MTFFRDRYMVMVLKFQNTSKEYPDKTASQKQSYLGQGCLSRLFGSQLLFKLLEHLP